MSLQEGVGETCMPLQERRRTKRYPQFLVAHPPKSPGCPTSALGDVDSCRIRTWIQRQGVIDHPLVVRADTVPCLSLSFLGVESLESSGSGSICRRSKNRRRQNSRNRSIEGREESIETAQRYPGTVSWAGRPAVPREFPAPDQSHRVLPCPVLAPGPHRSSSSANGTGDPTCRPIPLSCLPARRKGKKSY